MSELYLRDFHQAAGARFDELAGQQIVSEYANWLDEYDALRQTAGVSDLSFRGRICLLGADRRRFLHGQVTNNVNDLRPGQGCYAALVSAKGKLESDLNIYCLEEELLLDFEPGLMSCIAQRLEKYIIAEDVQLADVVAHYGMLSIQGPKAAEILRRLPDPLPAPEQAFTISKTHGEIYVARHPRLGSDGFDVFIPTERLRALAGQFAAAAPFCGWRAFETARIEVGIPRFGLDMDESNLAPEALDTRAISYAKGCYIGQEIIARIRTYGQVAKSLRRLQLGPGTSELPAKGAKLFHDGKEAGYITSAVKSPATGAVLCLGYVRREAIKAGFELSAQTPSGIIPARVIE